MAKKKLIICPLCGPDSEPQTNRGRGLCSRHYFQEYRKKKPQGKASLARKEVKKIVSTGTGAEDWSFNEFLASL